MLEGRAPSPSVRGVVEVDGDRSVAVWLSSLETVRVRQFGDPVPLRFVRIADANLAVLEPARIAPGGPGGERRFEITQPPGFGGMWSIEADAPTRVLIERVEEADPRYVAVEVEDDVLKWIADDGDPTQPPVLLEPDDANAGRLRLDAALARELLSLGEPDPSLERALVAWRMLAAMSALDTRRSSVRPYYVDARRRDRLLALEHTREVSLARSTSEEPEVDYRLAEQPRRWTIEAAGPGQLEIAARSWAADAVTLAPARLRVEAGGRVLAQVELSDRPARRASDPEAALPRFEPLLTRDGEAVGELATLVIPLAPGVHEYEVELRGGPALVSIDRAQRAEASLTSLRGWTPRKRARAADRALRRSKAEGAAWLELLLAEQTLAPIELALDDPRFDGLGRRSPLLAAVLLAVVAGDAGLDPARMDALVDRVRPWLASLARDPEIDPRVRARVRGRWLELLAIHERPELAAALIEAVEGGGDPVAELPVDALERLAQLMVAAPSRTPETTRSAALAVLELARAKAPADRRLRALSLRVWSEATIWSKRRPTPRAGAAWPFEPIGRWLVPLRGSPVELAARDVRWTQIVAGHPVRLTAARSSARPGERHMRLLDVFVSTPEGDPAPVGLRVDARRWWSPQLSGIVRHRVALSPGTHEIELEAPPDTLAWASLPPADEPGGEAVELARVERMWSLRDSVWSIPGPAVPGVVRLELRWLEDVPARAVRIAVVEEGEGGSVHERTIVFDPRTAGALDVDPDALPIYGSVAASVRHDLTFAIAPTTTSLRFEVEDGLELAASLSLRRSLGGGEAASIDDEGEDSAMVAAGFDDVFGDLASLAGDAILDELGKLSRELLAAPDAADVLARRAALLLMIGETGLARADMITLAGLRADDAKRARAEALLAELEARLSALTDPSEIVVAADVGDAPELIEPAIAAVVGDDRASLDPWLATWARARGGTVDAALGLVDARLAELSDDRSVLLGELSRAHWLAGDPGRARGAARAWLELYGRMPGQLGSVREPIAVAVAAVDPLLVHLGDPDSDARDASVAFGMVAQLERRYGHTSVRRLAMLAALRSGWSTLEHSENMAGFERLELPVADVELRLEARVRHALLAVPWGDAPSEQLSPNRKASLAWDAEPGGVRAEIWCRALRLDRGGADEPEPEMLAATDERARLRARLRGSTGVPVERTIDVADARLHAIELPVARAGRHQLELTLADDPRWLCAWRAEAQPDGASARAIEPSRRALWWTTAPNGPVEFTVLGPTTVQIESRAVVSKADDHGALQISVAAIERGEASSVEVALDGRPERAVVTERRRSFTVAHVDAFTLVLTEPGPHRVTLRSADGRVLIRARMRRDRGEFRPPERVAVRERDGGFEPAIVDEPARRGLGLGGGAVARDELEWRERPGTFDGLIRVGLDELGDAADLAVRFGVAAFVGWRRELVEDRVWVRAAAQLRTRERSPVSAGGILGVGARIPKIGLRMTAELDVLAEVFGGRPEASVRLTGFVDRPTWLGRRLQLVPRLYAGVRWQSLTPERVAAATTTLSPNPRVYQRYIHDHPLLLRPELALRYYPFSDLAVWTRAGMQPDSDLRSVDHVDLEAGFDGIGRKPQPWVPIWSGSYQASLRFASLGVPFYVRHGVLAELGLGVWIADAVRIAAGVRNEVYVSSASPLRDVVELWIRIDAALGRRMRDYGPGDLWFAEPWAPRAWADHEQQARSTGTKN